MRPRLLVIKAWNKCFVDWNELKILVVCSMLHFWRMDADDLRWKTLNFCSLKWLFSKKQQFAFACNICSLWWNERRFIVTASLKLCWECANWLQAAVEMKISQISSWEKVLNNHNHNHIQFKFNIQHLTFDHHQYCGQWEFKVRKKEIFVFNLIVESCYQKYWERML